MEIPTEKIEHAKRLLYGGIDPDNCSFQDLQRLAMRWKLAWLDSNYREGMGLIDLKIMQILAKILPDRLKTWEDGKLLKFAAPYLQPMSMKDFNLWLDFLTPVEIRDMSRIFFNKQQRMKAIQRYPGLVWKFYPPASDSEIMIAIVKDPMIIVDNSKADLKWISLASTLSNLQNRFLIGLTFRDDEKRANKIYGNFWNKLLGKTMIDTLPKHVRKY